jgi:predicted RNase H-like HicB family nuclease
LYFYWGYRKRSEKNIKEAIQLHIEGMKAEGYEIPTPSARALSIAI